MPGIRRLLLWLVLCVVAARLPARGSDSFVQGITISAQTWGQEWATPEMAAAIDEVKSLGANSIAIHPYAWIENDGSLKFSTDPDPESIAKPLDWARERGIDVMLIPHIGYWGSKFLWRGEIDFEKPSEWNRFFADYDRWILLMARAAETHGAKIFCVGLEYCRAQKYQTRWRQIIADVRKVYHGKLTYGANWNEFENVEFWDALDYIGVLAYFPLTRKTDPNFAELDAGWKPWMAKLERLSQQYGGKQVLFTEIGYNESAKCAAQPWAFETGGPNAKEIQARAIEQALNLHEEYPLLAGMFFWKWFPNLPLPGPETFDLRTPLIKSVIARHWAGARKVTTK